MSKDCNKENTLTLGCKISVELASDFKKYAATKGKTPNALLKEYILSCIGEHYGEEDHKTALDIMMEKHNIERVRPKPQETTLEVIRRLANEKK